MAYSPGASRAVVNHHKECTLPDHDHSHENDGTVSPRFVVELTVIYSVFSGRPDHVTSPDGIAASRRRVPYFVSWVGRGSLFDINCVKKSHAEHKILSLGTENRPQEP